MNRERAATIGSVGTANGSLSMITHESCSPCTSTPCQKDAVANKTAFGVSRNRSSNPDFDIEPCTKHGKFTRVETNSKSAFIEDNGGRSFFDYSVPQAVISLKQGIGRLIRSKTDRGVIAILDPRLRTKGYGRDFLTSLPRMRITSDLKDVAKIFDSGGDVAVGAEFRR